REMLVFIARESSGRGCRTQAQVSGIWFDLSCGNGAHAENVFIGDDCDGCRPDVGGSCRCTPLNPFGSYKVAVNDYIAAGGSGFIVLQRNTTKFNTGISLREALIDYIQNAVARCSADTCASVCQTDDCRSVCVDRACIDDRAQPHDGRIRMI